MPSEFYRFRIKWLTQSSKYAFSLYQQLHYCFEKDFFNSKNLWRPLWTCVFFGDLEKAIFPRPFGPRHGSQHPVTCSGRKWVSSSGDGRSGSLVSLQGEVQGSDRVFLGREREFFPLEFLYHSSFSFYSFCTLEIVWTK